MASFDKLVAPNIGQIAPATGVAGGATTGAMQAGNLAYSQLPGYLTSLGNVGANIGSETAGQVPDDVIRQMQQQAAERGVATGTGGNSPNSNAAYLRALGLTSLNLTQQGQQNLQSILPTLPGAQISQNPSYYQTFQQQYEAALQQDVFNRQQQQQQFELQQQQQALKAAQSGLSAGRGAFSSPIAAPVGAPNEVQQFMSQPWGAPNPPAMGASGYGTGGTYIGGQYYAPGQSPSQSYLDVAKQYSDTIGGGEYDPVSGLWTPTADESSPELEGLTPQEIEAANTPAYDYSGSDYGYGDYYGDYGSY